MTPRKRIAALFLIPVCMFAFGFLLVPIYNVFCDLTGLNGKTGSIEVVQVSRLKVDYSRTIKVEFMANRNHDMPLDFAPLVRSMQVHPGKSYRTAYTAHNQRARAMIGQAVPSVSPAKAANYFNKVECFCFSQQTFAPNEQREMPVVFVVDSGLPKNIKTVTLSYTFFDVTNGVNHDGMQHEDMNQDDMSHINTSDKNLTTSL